MKNKLNTLMNTLEHELGKARSAARYAQSGASMFGMYEDCGHEYVRDYIETRAVLDFLEELMPRLREHVKKRK